MLKFKKKIQQKISFIKKIFFYLNKNKNWKTYNKILKKIIKASKYFDSKKLIKKKI